MKQLFFEKKRFGATYAKGIRAGICLSASKAGRAHKVPFAGRNLLHYCSLQLQLLGQPVSACVSGECGRTQCYGLTARFVKILCALLEGIVYYILNMGDEP